MAADTASKSGLMGLTQALAAEFGPKGVRVHAVSPGWIYIVSDRAVSIHGAEYVIDGGTAATV